MGSVCDTGHTQQNSGVDPRRSDCGLAQGPAVSIYVLRALTTEGAEPLSHAGKGICEHLLLGPCVRRGTSGGRPCGGWGSS